MARLLPILATVFACLTPACPWTGSGEPYEASRGEFHTPPDVVIAGKETILTYRFVFTPGPGGPGSGAAKRFGQMECHYRVNGQKEFRVVIGKRVAADKESITVEFSIPPLKADDGGTLEYHSGGTFDGTHATMKHKPHKVPLRPQ